MSFERTLKRYPALQMEALNIDNDHLHLQIEISPDVAVSEVVMWLKKESSKDLKKRFPYIQRMYVEPSIWSVGYFSSTIGLNEQTIRRYIDHQGEEEKPKQVKLGFE